MTSSSTSTTLQFPASNGWQFNNNNNNNYPNAIRDNDYVIKYKSKQLGDQLVVDVKDPYIWLEKTSNESDLTKKWVQSQAKFTHSFLKNLHLTSILKKTLTKTWNYPRTSLPSYQNNSHYYFAFNKGLQPQAVWYYIHQKQIDDGLLENVLVEKDKDQDEEGKDEEGGKMVEGKKPRGKVFFDPNKLSQDGTVAVSTSSFSKSGRYWAYGLSKSGSDWETYYVRNGLPTTTEEEEDVNSRLPDEIKNVKYSGLTWTNDEKGFFYQTMPQPPSTTSTSSTVDPNPDPDLGTETDPSLNAQLYYHKIGDLQSKDVLVYKDEQNPNWMFSIDVSWDGRWAFLIQTKDTGRSNKLWVTDLNQEGNEIGLNLDWKKIGDDFKGDRGFIGNIGTKLFIQTNINAPRNKIVVYDLDDEEKGFQDHIPEDSQGGVLSWATITNTNYLLICYQIDAKDVVYLYELQSGKRISKVWGGGKPEREGEREREREGEEEIGSIIGVKAKEDGNEFWLQVTGFTNPSTILRYQFGGGNKDGDGEGEGDEDGKKKKGLSVYQSTSVPGLEPDEFISEQVFYTSKDGTRVPMFITYHKDFKKDGNGGAWLYGYGGFSHSEKPRFSVSMLSYVKHFKAVYCVANIRGGDEYGEEWHLAGTKDRKQNVFDDFQYAAKYLTEEKWTRPDKLTISGGSNGGLLVGACVNQAPELYGAAIADVGVMDMLKYHTFSIGRAWSADYGTSDDPEGFDYLIKYSPLHNVDSNKIYPAYMLTTSDHDDRVVPLHSFKLAATLQHDLPNNPNPILLRVELNAGHGAGKPMSKVIQETADRLSFAAAATKLTAYF